MPLCKIANLLSSVNTSTLQLFIPFGDKSVQEQWYEFVFREDFRCIHQGKEKQALYCHLFFAVGEEGPLCCFLFRTKSASK